MEEKKNEKFVGLVFRNTVPLWGILVGLLTLWFMISSMAYTSSVLTGLIAAVAILILWKDIQTKNDMLSAYQHMTYSDIRNEARLQGINLITEVKMSWVEESQYYKENLKHLHEKTDA